MKNSRLPLACLLALSAILALVGVFALTDLGQIFNIGKAAVIGYFRYHWIYILGSVVLFAAAVLVNRSRPVLRKRWLAVFGMFILGCFIATKFAVPYIMFPAHQHDAEYRPAAEAEGYLSPDDVVYVVDRNGVARAFPQRLIWQPHILGGDYGNERVVMTYCVMSNLPVPFHEEFDGKAMDLRVLAQTNNNLLMWDTNSGEIIQQITQNADLSDRRLEPLPVLEMSWKAFRELYPDGLVLHYEFDTPLERALDLAMPIDEAIDGEEFMFNTVSLDDTRVRPKEQMVGVADGDEAVAFTRGALRRAGITNIRVGDKSLVLAHFPKHDFVAAFHRAEAEVTKVDPFGRTPDQGTLKRAFIYNGVFWAVWLHYHPNTKLIQ